MLNATTVLLASINTCQYISDILSTTWETCEPHEHVLNSIPLECGHKNEHNQWMCTMCLWALNACFCLNGLFFLLFFMWNKGRWAKRLNRSPWNINCLKHRQYKTHLKVYFALAWLCLVWLHVLYLKEENKGKPCVRTFDSFRICLNFLAAVINKYMYVYVVHVAYILLDLWHKFFSWYSNCW